MFWSANIIARVDHIQISIDDEGISRLCTSFAEAWASASPEQNQAVIVCDSDLLNQSVNLVNGRLPGQYLPGLHQSQPVWTDDPQRDSSRSVVKEHTGDGMR